GGDLDPEGSKNLGGDTDDTTETAQDEDDRGDRARVLPKPRRHSRERLAEQLERRDEDGCGLTGNLGQHRRQRAHDRQQRLERGQEYIADRLTGDPEGFAERLQVVLSLDRR